MVTCELLFAGCDEGGWEEIGLLSEPMVEWNPYAICGDN